MTIEIEALRFQAVLGILDFEREAPQDIVIDIQIIYDFCDEFINYAEVVKHIKKSMIESKFLLIEDALEALSNQLHKQFPTIKELKIKIAKPSILPDCSVSVSNSYQFDS